MQNMVVLYGSGCQTFTIPSPVKQQFCFQSTGTIHVWQCTMQIILLTSNYYSITSKQLYIQYNS
jgi:hypothetical protein